MIFFFKERGVSFLFPLFLLNQIRLKRVTVCKRARERRDCSKNRKKRERKRVYLTGIELSVLSMTGLAREISRARAPPKTATNARIVAIPANSESANEGAASGSKRSPSLLLSFLFSARATTTLLRSRPPAVNFDRMIEMLGRSLGAAIAGPLRAVLGKGEVEAALTESAELAERGVALAEARIRRGRGVS